MLYARADRIVVVLALPTCNEKVSLLHEVVICLVTLNVPCTCDLLRHACEAQEESGRVGCVRLLGHKSLWHPGASLVSQNLQAQGIWCLLAYVLAHMVSEFSDMQLACKQACNGRKRCCMCQSSG